MFRTLLIANRGEIACRVIRTARRMGIRTVAVFSDADRNAQHVRLADEAMHIGGDTASESYLRGARILEVARATGSEAVHPGYGFLSENADFAEACASAGVVFVGPSPHALRTMGLKSAAKDAVAAEGVPTVPGYHGDTNDLDRLDVEASRVGFPLLVKAIAGGGGRGMRRVERPEQLADALESARREAKAGFGDERVLIERYIERARHIEVQIFGDAHGNVVHLFERDCSTQRRHQKVIEEAPAPGVTPALRARMGEAAVAAARSVGYVGAGTVELIVEMRENMDAAEFFFMEMNTRLQVEHPVTELVTGIDLVEWQLRVAAGEPLPVSQSYIELCGFAVEARLYAEDPAREFIPSPGVLVGLALPEDGPGVRVDSGVVEGDRVTPHYDAMIAKVIGHGPTRQAAVLALERALDETLVLGIASNRDLLRRLVGHDEFRAGGFDTGWLERALPELTAPAAASTDVLLVAALLTVDALERDGRERARSSTVPGSPWHVVDGFRLQGRASVTVTLELDGEAHTFACRRDGEALLVRGEHATHRLESREITRASARVRVDGHERTFAVLRRGGTVAIGDGLSTQVVSYRDPEAAEYEEAPGTATLVAPLPGTLVTMLARVGDVVSRGDVVAVVEAMKMEHELTAGVSGRVASVAAEAGARVDEGQVLIVIEPEADEAS